MKLLKQDALTATEVAEAVGFMDYNNFGRMFRKYYGYTPLEARKKTHVGEKAQQNFRS